MSHNRAFWKAFHSLTHPLSILAILLLLFNDHWLRYAHPSWLTGKLGDFTWLLFAPFIAGLLFAWCVPRRLEQHTKIVGWLSIGFIGVWFATAKTIPFVHHITTETLYAIVGWEGQLRLDITDLLTLPALLISWTIWHTASEDKVSLKPLAYVAFGLGILGTLASDGPTQLDYGIREICNTGDALFVDTINGYGHRTVRQSDNGGLLWYTIPHEDFDESQCLDDSAEVTTDIQFRWTPTDKIERSSDDGEAWETDYDLAEQRQEIRYMRRHSGMYNDYIIDDPGPHDLTYDTSTGNFVFAMGWDGILVRESTGQYTWVKVDHYFLPETLGFPEFSISSYIFLEMCLAIATVFLVITTSTAYIRRHTIRLGMRKASWGLYAIILITLIIERFDPIHSAFSMGVPMLAGLISLVAMFAYAIPLSIGAVWDILRNFRSVALNIALAGIANGSLFIFPFLLWTQGRIPRYVTAYAFSIMLTMLGLYATRAYLKRILPTLNPEKVKNDTIEKEKTSDSPLK